MSPILDQLKATASELPLAERAELAHYLLDTLEPADEGVAEAWQLELDSATFIRSEKKESSVFGLKGRFCQPRAKPWELGRGRHVGPARAVQLPSARTLVKRPYRANVWAVRCSQGFALG